MSERPNQADAAASRQSENVETVGIRPIPEARRNMSALSLFSIWGLASASATTPVIGLLLYDVGLTNFCIAVVIAGLIGIIPAGLFSEQGREVPLISLVTARATFGPGASFLLALLYTITGAGWFGLNTDVGGQILSTLYPGHGNLWYWLLGIGQTALVFLGMKWLERFYNWTAFIFIASYAVLIYYMVSRYTIVWPVAPSGAVHWGAIVQTILSFSLLAWAYEFSTVSRFCPPRASSESRLRRASYFCAATVGVLLPVLLMGTLGLVGKASTGEWNIALIAKDLPLTGAIAALGVILAIAHTNAMNLYPAVTKLLAAGETFRTPRRYDQPLASLVLGAIATVLAVAGILNFVEPFLLLLGVFLFPFTFLMMFDWVVVQKRATPVAAFFEKKGTAAELFRPSACIAFVFGVVLSALGHFGVLPAMLTEHLPWPVVASLIACGLYWGLLRVCNDPPVYRADVAARSGHE
ncbi:cytosine permease [Salinisphaera sp. Q1T1-3]|uniref:purine-cytosine permease family protein n=1 Tax=Salinisphaera sp. Q1T1-3 TaxID=2321229 RepID=UPI000E7375E0|nr:cytosine permease [Salinisphaera sp. Q1T1-3]RJS92369.1 thiamine permease [Salinisphaera sp. Q1T1-3]